MNQTDDDSKLCMLFLSFKNQQMYLKNQTSNNLLIDAVFFWYMSNLFEEFSCSLFHSYFLKHDFPNEKIEYLCYINDGVRCSLWKSIIIH